MTSNVYWLSLMMSVNGSAQYVATMATVLLLLALVARYGLQQKVPALWPLWVTLAVSVLVATIAPSRGQVIAAVAVDQGPAVAKSLVDALRSE